MKGLLLAAFAAAAFPPGILPDTVTVVLRYDDYSALSPLDLEARFLEACARHRVPVTIGVVPEAARGDSRDPSGTGTLPLDGPKRDLLVRYRDGGVAEIALHGYTHRTASARRRSEFAGVPAPEQDAKMARGKADLEAFAGPLRTFIPPWNAYDAGTLAALAAQGFTVLSADGQGAAGRAPGLRYVPATCLIPELRRAVAWARTLASAQPGRKPLVVAYFHPYEFREADSARGMFSFREFEETLAWLAAQPDVKTLTLGQAGRLPAAEAGVYSAYARYKRLSPPFLERALRPCFRVYPHPGFPVPGGGILLLGLLAGFHLLPALLLGTGTVLLGRTRWAAGVRLSKRRETAWGICATALAGAVIAIGWASFPALLAASGLLGIGWGLGRTSPPRLPAR